MEQKAGGWLEHCEWVSCGRRVVGGEQAGSSHALGTGLGFGFYPKCYGKPLEVFKQDANMIHTHTHIF